jgi:hypothetical protein
MTKHPGINKYFTIVSLVTAQYLKKSPPPPFFEHELLIMNFWYISWKALATTISNLKIEVCGYGNSTSTIEKKAIATEFSECKNAHWFSLVRAYP